MKILVTRPSCDAEKTAAELAALGHEAVVAPLMEIRFREGPEIPLGDVQGVLVTSANGVRALARRTERRDVPIFAVGAQTARHARESGFQYVRSAEGSAKTLVRAVTGWARPKDGPLFHACGEHVKHDPAAGLAAAGFRVQSEILYEACDVKILPQSAAAALAAGGVDAVLLYSQRSARIFAGCVIATDLAEACRSISAFCISEETAASLAPLKFRAIRVAVRPNQKDLFALLR